MEPAAKPKRVLSEEQKAKMAAGRAAAKARRDAEKAAAAEAAPAPAAEKPKRTLSDEQKAKMAAGRAAARERKAAAAPADAPAAPDADKPAKPKRVLSDEQKAKMAAGRAAAKARKAAAPAAPAPVEKPAAAAAVGRETAEEPEVVEVHLVDWEHDFGTGSRTYKRLDDDGMTYIYDYETRKYLGAYVEKTNKLKPSVPDPLAADD